MKTCSLLVALPFSRVLQIKRCLYAGRKSRVWCANTKAGVRVALKGYLKAELTENDAVKVRTRPPSSLSFALGLSHKHLGTSATAPHLLCLGHGCLLQ